VAVSEDEVVVDVGEEVGQAETEAAGTTQEHALEIAVGTEEH
jgi:hypothetical protein